MRVERCVYLVSQREAERLSQRDGFTTNSLPNFIISCCLDNFTMGIFFQIFVSLFNSL